MKHDRILVTMKAELNEMQVIRGDLAVEAAKVNAKLILEDERIAEMVEAIRLLDKE